MAFTSNSQDDEVIRCPNCELNNLKNFSRELNSNIAIFNCQHCSFLIKDPKGFYNNQGFYVYKNITKKKRNYTKTIIPLTLFGLFFIYNIKYHNSAYY